ncbi:iron-sulfur cluster biosynthesis transcriptional regulator SufR [Trichothermofontia sichuanensis]|uniref:iron-sulfur cluster biosynthesis transcriptional regulator SufR n=1 Tax=Trichothermofontia sichuanensis TaxID=3045816 RepID=UPI00249E68E3
MPSIALHMTTTQHTSTKQDILQFLLKHGQATAQTLADALDISPQAVRRHLKDLEADALILHHSVQEGTGRPTHVYELSQTGRAQFPANYDRFALSLLDTLAETVGEEGVGSILRKQWQRKALEYQQQLGKGSLRDRVERLANLRRAEGYMAEWYPVEASKTGGTATQFILTEHNCAISSVAESFPSVCGHELEMFAAALPDCVVERTHWINEGQHRCGYLIQAKLDERSA